MSIATQPSAFRHLRLEKIRGLGWRKILLGCGAVSTLLYFGMDVLASLLHDGYIYKDQTISELSAIDAPTRSLWIPLGFLYSVLVIAGGLGIWASAGPKRALRVVACLVAAVGFIGLVAWPFAPMHQREVLAAGGGTLSDTMHLVLGAVDSLLFMIMIAFGSMAFGRRFRSYSIATLLVVLVLGGLTGLDAPKVGANEPTPWLGVKERIVVFGSMLWISVLAITLLRCRIGANSDHEKTTVRSSVEGGVL